MYEKKKFSGEGRGGQNNRFEFPSNCTICTQNVNFVIYCKGISDVTIAIHSALT